MGIKEEIENLLYENAEDFQMAKLLKSDIAAYFQTLGETFTTSGGRDFLLKHTRKIDEIVKLVYKIALYGMFKSYQPMKNSLPLSIAALGSYGREQLCVRSDIDLLFVYRDFPGYNTKSIIEKILYLLWDCGLKLGHRVHKVDELLEASRSDITIKTALIESRFVDGSRHLWAEAGNELDSIRHDDQQSFIRKRLSERAALHKKFPLNMEPNLKEGIGGMRDANLVYWIGRVLYNIDHIPQLPDSIILEEEYHHFYHALEFIFRVRSALHLVNGKKEDTLRLEQIPDVARYLGYEESQRAHTQCSQKTLDSLKTVHLYTTIWLELLCQKYSIKEDGILEPFDLPPNAQLERHLHLLAAHADKEYAPSPLLLQQLIHAPKPDKITADYLPLIREIFQKQYAHSLLETLSQAKLLEYAIPPLKVVINLPQFDGYHLFPVDTHSLSCLYHLEHIKEPFILALYRSLQADEREMLKLVTLLHDAGKGRKKDHSLVGASLYKIFAKALGLTDDMTEAGIILIHNHTLLSNTAQREDIYDEKIIMSFASRFKTKKMLDLIYILTYADLNGVAADIYNSFTAHLIHTLYTLSLESLRHSEMLNETAQRAKKEKSLMLHESFKQLSKQEQKKILAIPSNLFFLRYSSEKIIQIATDAWSVKDFHYLITNQDFLTIEIIRKNDFNIGYLLGKLSIYNLASMNLCKLSDEYKYFQFEFSEKPQNDELPFIARYIEEGFDLAKSVTLRKPIIHKEDISVNCDHSRNYVTLRLNTTDQKGLIAYIVTLFDSYAIDIITAKIHTHKMRTRDMFLMERGGNFCQYSDTIIKKLTQDDDLCAE